MPASNFPGQTVATQFFIQDLVLNYNRKDILIINHHVVKVQPVLGDHVDTGRDTQTDQAVQSSARENAIEDKSSDEPG